MKALGQGHYTDILARRYHADDLAEEPSLSSSLAVTLVSKTPRLAFLSHPRLNPQFVPEVDEKFDLGSAVHDGLASGGKRLALVDGYDDWRTKDSKTIRDHERAKGNIPLLRAQADQVGAIVGQVQKQLKAAGITLGVQESVLIAQDRGVTLRAMVDALDLPNLYDFKVSKINLADDDTVGRHLSGMDYDLRAWFYLRCAELVFPEWAGRLKYFWILVEEDEPHGIRIVECDATFREMGRRKGECAIGLWERCMRTGQWPHLEGLPKTVPYPGFAENRWLERETRESVQGPLATMRDQQRESLVDE